MKKLSLFSGLGLRLVLIGFVIDVPIGVIGVIVGC